MARATQRSRPFVVTLTALVILAGCGAGGAGEGEGSPQDAVRAYIAALDAHDGRRYCAGIAPYVSGRIDLATREPDGGVRARGCPAVVTGLLDYGENAARLEQIGEPVGSASLKRVNVRVAVRGKGEEGPYQETLTETVWVARLSGGWRIARAERLLPFGDVEQPGDLTPPDIEAEQRRFADELRGFEQHLADRRAAYRQTGELGDCGGVTIRDPAGDVQEYLRRRPAQADLRSVQVAVVDRKVCVTFEIADEVKAPMRFTYNHRDSASGSDFIQLFEVELRADGTARVASGQDDDDRSLSVPARVGVEGKRLTVELTPDSFARGAPTPSTRDDDPPVERFAFMADSGAKRGEIGEAHDYLGREPSPSSFVYPSGRACNLAAC